MTGIRGATIGLRFEGGQEASEATVDGDSVGGRLVVVVACDFQEGFGFISGRKIVLAMVKIDNGVVAAVNDQEGNLNRWQLGDGVIF